MPSISLRDGYLTLPRLTYPLEVDNRADIQSVFDYIFTQVLGLVRDQIDTVP